MQRGILMDSTASLAAACRAMAACLRSGGTIIDACDSASSVGSGEVPDTFRRLAADLRVGVVFADAVERWRAHLDCHAADILAESLQVAIRRGNSLVPTCQRVALLLHERARLIDEAKSATAPARLSSRLVLILPCGALVTWLAASPTSFMQLLHGRSGVLMLPSFVGILIGASIIRRITDRMQLLVSPGDEPERESRLMSIICGDGSLHHQIARGAVIGASALLGASMAGGRPPGVRAMIFAGIMASMCGAWPVLRKRKRLRQREREIDLGLPSLIEVTVAMLAAGAQPEEALTTSIGRTSPRLRARLESIASQVRMGRTLDSALMSSSTIHASSILSAWAHSLALGVRTGMPARAQIEGLLVDVRAAERERFRRASAAIGPRIQLVVVLVFVPAITWVVLVATVGSLASQATSLYG